MKEIIDEIAKLEHQQWCQWSKSIAKDLELMVDEIETTLSYWKNKGAKVDKKTITLLETQKNRLKRWETLWVPYEELNEDMKDIDRHYARLVLNRLAEIGVEINRGDKKWSN